jgi:pyruvate formate lyase activating enzyme
MTENSKTLFTRREFGELGAKTLLGVGCASLLSNSLAFAMDDSQALHEARFYRKLDGNRVQCQLCFRRCVVSNGNRGFCRNRENRDGTYYTIVYGKPSALQIDPIEKEPCYHMWPGTRIFCTGTASCNNRCQFCHNWHLSQRSLEELHYYLAKPEDIVKVAQKYECESLSFTYNEPTVFYEYMYDIVKLGKEQGFGTLYHTNGLINEEPLLALLEYMNAVTVDLKAFTDTFYREVCSSRLDPVLKTLKNIRNAEKHLEVVNLMIPTLNDNPDDVRSMCQWIVENLGEDTPLHFSRFHPNYKLTNLPPTPIETLEQAYETATQEGLHYVTIGNAPGHEHNSTFCPNCKKKIIHRIHFQVLENNVEDGKCKFCEYPITGIWS